MELNTTKELIEDQLAIQKDLGQLDETVESLAGAESLLDQARQAAYEATGNIFDRKPESAIEVGPKQHDGVVRQVRWQRGVNPTPVEHPEDGHDQLDRQ